MGCEEKGREYLQKQAGAVVFGLMQHLGTKGNTELQAIVAFQRLSLRRPLQMMMIEKGLIEWIVAELGSDNEHRKCLSDIALEFGSALLMNLALRTKGKLRMEKINALEVLVSLLDHPNAQVRTQANGTLYSLFSLPSAHEAARKLGLEEILRRIIKTEDEIHVKQLEYLLDLLEKGPKETLEESESEDLDDECFLEEEELSAWAIPEAPYPSIDWLPEDRDCDNGYEVRKKFQDFIFNSKPIPEPPALQPPSQPTKQQVPAPAPAPVLKLQQSVRASSAEDPRTARQTRQTQGQGQTTFNNLLKRKEKLTSRTRASGSGGNSHDLRGRQHRIK